MHLQGEQLAKHFEEIQSLHVREFGLGGEVKNGQYFAILEGEELQAVASLKNYWGYWYLRGCVVKPEFRGNGFQRQLIRERIGYLAGKTDEARVSVLPNNLHSLTNLIYEGFVFEKQKNIKGKLHHVYKRDLLG